MATQKYYLWSLSPHGFATKLGEYEELDDGRVAWGEACDNHGGRVKIILTTKDGPYDNVAIATGYGRSE